MTEAQAAAYRAKLSGKPVKATDKPDKTRPDKRLIDAAYSTPEPGISILEVPCYLPTTNEILGQLKIGNSWLVNGWRKAARSAVLGCLARAMPNWCADQTEAARLEHRAQTLRDSVTFMVLARIAPKVCDDDNNVGALKGVRDTVCAWLVCGPIFDVENIGSYDEIIYSPVNPSGRVQLVCDQDVRPAKRGQGKFGVKIELHSQ